MDWPTAMVVVTAAAPITAAILRFVPRRPSRELSQSLDKLTAELRELVNELHDLTVLVARHDEQIRALQQRTQK